MGRITRFFCPNEVYPNEVVDVFCWHVDLYTLLGGMPEVAATYQHNQDLSEVQRPIQF